MAAKKILKKAAKAIPKKMAFFLSFGGKPEAAIPIINALSPDKIMSAKIIWIMFEICSVIFLGLLDFFNVSH